ncbi:hypothetical protein ACFSCX_11785 [Bacillus salitolerans]|uniref:Uncharacterized protein n=1 Tax=Bacillus salitolerans TaxID=1437434 RepID=A0ABW4LT05_9BACI
MSGKIVKVISEEYVAKYVELNEQAKRIKEEMDKIKQVFHTYFDELCGMNEKGEFNIGDYFLQRQIRITNAFDEERLVEKLEALKLGDCIEYVKKPNEQKLEAAIQLGLISEEDIKEYRLSKRTQAISVKKAK